MQSVFLKRRGNNKEKYFKKQAEKKISCNESTQEQEGLSHKVSRKQERTTKSSICNKFPWTEHTLKTNAKSNRKNKPYLPMTGREGGVFHFVKDETVQWLLPEYMVAGLATVYL